jgi:hypothetical protein
MRRLAAAGYEHNQTDLEFLRAVPGADVPHVLSVLQAWLDEDGPEALGPGLLRLRDALSARAGA